MGRGRRSLTDEQVEEIRNYLSAHKWKGARTRIAIKYGVSQAVIFNVLHKYKKMSRRDEVITEGLA